MRIYRHILIELAVFGLLAAPARATLSVRTFGDEASFLANAGPGLGLVDFTGLATVPLSVPTLDTTTDVGLVDPGDIPPGVAFSTTGPAGLFLAPVGFFGVTSESLIVPTFDDPLVVSFDPGVNAVSADVLSFLSATTIMVTVRDPGGATFDLSVALPATDVGYAGIVANEGEIVQIEYDPPAGFSVGLDNLRYGRVGDAASSVLPVATPEPLSVTLFGVGLAGLAAVSHRRRAS